MDERYREEFRVFQGRMDEALKQDRIDSHICMERLEALDRSMEGSHPLPRRIEFLNRFAVDMSDHAHTHLRFLAKEGFEDLHYETEIPETSFDAYRRRVTRFDRCFKNMLDDLQRFNENHPETPLTEETFRLTHNNLVHFEQLVQTYIRLLEFKLPRRDGEGASR